MRAIIVEDGALVWGEAETPHAGPGEVRIQVHATAVNRADLIQKAGHYPPPPGASEVLGLECAGVVDQVGEEVEGWSPGDRVCALLSGGGYAEYAVVPAGQVLPLPDERTFIEGAALPEVFATAWLNLFREAELKPGEAAVIHAGASGVGTAGIQLCRTLGIRCFVTVGSDEKLERCIALGAHGGANRHQAPWTDALRAWSPPGVDAILDCVGANYLADNLKSLRTDGRLVVIGLLGGRSAELDLGRLLVKRLRVVGSTLRSRSVEAKSEIVADLLEYVWPHLREGDIHPVIDQVFPIEEADAAHGVLANNENVGKVVLTIEAETDGDESDEATLIAPQP